jgi:hypothetical protein
VVANFFAWCVWRRAVSVMTDDLSGGVTHDPPLRFVEAEGTLRAAGWPAFAASDGRGSLGSPQWERNRPV